MIANKYRNTHSIYLFLILNYLSRFIYPSHSVLLSSSVYPSNLIFPSHPTHFPITRTATSSLSLPLNLSVCPCVCLYVCLPMCLPICLSAYVLVYLCVCLSAHVSICLFSLLHSIPTNYTSTNFYWIESY